MFTESPSDESDEDDSPDYQPPKEKKKQKKKRLWERRPASADVNPVSKPFPEAPCLVDIINAGQNLTDIFPGEDWLKGRLEDVLAHAVHIRKDCDDSDPMNSSLSSALSSVFYFAPLHEVDPTVLSLAKAAPYHSPSQPGFRAPASWINVRFLADPRPGRGPGGESRARAVVPTFDLVSPSPNFQTQGIKSMSASSSSKRSSKQQLAFSQRGLPLTESMYATGLRAVAMVAMVTKEWLALKAPDALRAAVDALEEDLRSALQESDGSRLCDVLLRATGGLAPPGCSLWASSTKVGVKRGLWMTSTSEDHISMRTDVEQLRGVQEHRLRSLVVTCLSNLDLAYAGVRAHVLPALRHLQLLIAAAHGGIGQAKLGRLQWRRIADIVEASLGPEHRRTPLSGRGRRLGGRLYALPVPPPKPGCAPGDRICNVAGCFNKACTRTPHEADELGPKGPRCPKHGWKPICNALGCTTTSVALIPLDDEFGPKGMRCVKHGARRCNVNGCRRMACARVVVVDGFGAPGRRCFEHGRSAATRCCVPHCLKKGKRRMESWDRWGPPGMRCHSHGAQKCQVPGCAKLRWGRTKVADEHGPPGSRCHIHGGVRCSVDGCARQPVRKITVADEYGRAGVRCERHSTPHVKRHGPQLEQTPSLESICEFIDSGG